MNTLQESFFRYEPVVSPGGKYVFVPEEKGVKVINAQAGTAVSQLPTSSGCKRVAINNEGDTLAMLCQNTLTICDLTNGRTDVHEFGSTSDSRVAMSS